MRRKAFTWQTRSHPFRNVHLVKKLDSSEKEYDALVLVGAQLEQLKDHVDDSVMKHLEAFSQVNKQ